MVPKLRFKEFCGEWEEKRLGDVFTFIATNSFSRNDLNYIEGDIYNVHYGDIHMVYPTITDAQKEIFPYINKEKKLDVCSEILCKDGDVLLADASEDYDDIGKAIEIINVGDKKIVSGLHTIFMRDYKKIYANKFRGFMMNSNSVRKQIKVLAAGAKVLGISKSNITKVKMPLPSLQEQTKIADFLSTVDDKIQNQQDKITHLENIKKGFMQKIFSRKIRFKNDGGEEFPAWERTTIGESGYFYYGKSAPKWSIKDDATIPCIRYGELYTTHNIIVKNIKSYTSIDKENLKFSKGNEILVPRVGEEPLDFCKCCYLPFPNIAIGEMISVYNTENNPLFISYLFNATMKYEFARRVEGGNVSNLYFVYLENIPMMLPCLEEQQKIADLLSSFDEKISIQKETLEHLKQIKKGLLQQMFV